MSSALQVRWRHFLWNALRYGIGPLSGLIITWIVVDRASFSRWGEVVTLMIWVQLGVHLAQWGNRELLIREFGRQRESQWLVLQGMITRVPILLVVMIPLAFFAKDLIVPVIAWTALLYIAQAAEPGVIRDKSFSKAALAELLALSVQLGYLLLVPVLSVEHILWCFPVAQGIRALLLHALIGTFDHLPDPLADMRLHLQQGTPFFLSGVSALLASRADLYVVDALLERTLTGQYQLISSVFVQAQAFSMLLTTPFTRDLYRSPTSAIQRSSVRISRWTLLAMPLLATGCWILFGPVFGIHPSPLVIVAGCLATWPSFAYVPLIYPVYRAGMERPVMWANLGAAVLSVSVTWFLVPRIGLAGGLFGAAIGQWVMLLVVRKLFSKVHAMS
ncbi:MAG: hypothetical protein KDB88_12120 [Flavobacteriales bacterium]|nr:hypothetical protein [Flavobacteriales bacterium]